MRRAGWLLAALLLLSGCAGPLHPREIDTLQCVETLGYDVREGEVILSVSDAGEDTVRLNALGRTIPEAVEHLQELSDREELFFAHVRFALAGEEAARAGLEPLLDWFRRSPQTRLRLPLLVVRGDTARSLVTGGGPDSEEITRLLRSFEETGERLGAPRCADMLAVTRQLNRSGAALCAAVRRSDAAGSAPDREEAQVVLPAGYAVLRGGALAGFLDTDAARGADLLAGEAGEAEYVLPGGDSLKLRRSQARLTLDGTHLTVTSSLRAGITALGEGGALTAERRRAMERALAAQVTAELDAALTAAKLLDADFSELWLRYRGELGREDFLRALTWELRVEVTVERSYDIDGGVPLGGEE